MSDYEQRIKAILSGGKTENKVMSTPENPSGGPMTDRTTVKSHPECQRCRVNTEKNRLRVQRYRTLRRARGKKIG